MKTTLLFLLTMVIISCNSDRKTEITKEFVKVKPKDIKSKKLIDTTQHTPVDNIVEITTPKFTSKIRPNKAISINQIYTDTIVFSAYDDDYDYFILTGKKNNIDVAFIYNWEHESNEQYNFKYGDQIKVKWKMDSIWIAGEGDALNFHERAIDATRIE